MEREGETGEEGDGGRGRETREERERQEKRVMEGERLEERLIATAGEAERGIGWRKVCRTGLTVSAPSRSTLQC